LAKNSYRELVRLLKTTVRFTSSNDELAIAHYENIMEAGRERDRARQRAKRLNERIRSARIGAFDSKVISILEGERLWRQIQHLLAWKHPQGPRQLKQAPQSASVFDAQVWLAKTRIELRDSIANPSNAAREMQTLGFELGRSQNALRVAVRRSLTRVSLLERTAAPGRQTPIWPKFGRRELREALDFDPLQALAPNAP
jgi:hypothetical protein